MTDLLYQLLVELLKPTLDSCLKTPGKNRTVVLYSCSLQLLYMEALIVYGAFFITAMAVVYHRWRNPFIERPYLNLTPEERALLDSSNHLITPHWANDPITKDLMIRPRLTIDETLDAQTSQTYDANSLEILRQEFDALCALTSRKIIHDIDNIELLEAITYWVRSKISSGDNSQAIPAWARSEYSKQVMTRPCLCFTKRTVRSIDLSEAQQLPFRFFRNYALQNAIEDLQLERRPEL